MADRAVVAEVATLLGERTSQDALDDESLMQVEQRLIGSLVSALQKKASEQSVKANVDVLCGNPAVVIPGHAAEDRCVVAVGRAADHLSVAYHSAIDIVLRSTRAVLVV